VGAGSEDPNFYKAVPVEAINYMFVQEDFQIDMVELNDWAKPVDKKFAEMLGYGLTSYGAQGYSAIYTIYDVLQRAGSVDKEKVRDALAKTNITSGPATGIMGWQKIAFDKDGQNVDAHGCISQNFKASGPPSGRWPTGPRTSSPSGRFPPGRIGSPVACPALREGRAVLRRARWETEGAGMDPIILGIAVVNGIVLGGLYGAIAVGLSLIFGVMRVINFAHGSFLMIGLFIPSGSGSSFGSIRMCPCSWRPGPLRPGLPDPGDPDRPAVPAGAGHGPGAPLRPDAHGGGGADHRQRDLHGLRA